MEIKTAIVNGAKGKIARALVRELVADGVKVFALKPPTFELNDDVFNSDLVTVIDSDIRETLDAEKKIDSECDAIFHFAWLGTFGDTRDDAYLQNDNIKYTIDTCKLGVMTGCKVFVGAGSQAEYGTVSTKLTPDTPTNPQTGYAIAKFAAGKLSKLFCDANNMCHCWTRILSVFGVGMNPATLLPSAINKFLSGERATFTKGEQDWDFLYCDDCAKAFYAIAKNGVHGKTNPIGSGTTRNLREFIEITRDAVNPDIPLYFGEVPYNKNQAMYLCSDNTEIYNDTGFKPTISFEEGIKLLVEDIINQKQQEML